MFLDERTLKAELFWKYSNESVYCTPYISINKYRDGLSKTSYLDVSSFILTKGRYIQRKEAEYSNTFTQIIPLVLIQDESNRLFISNKTINDSRNLLNLNIGISSHIKPELSRDNIISNSIEHKINLHFKKHKLKFLGTIREMSGKFYDHLGLVFIYKVNSNDFIYSGDFLSYSSLENRYFEFKSWSKIIIDYLSNNKSLFF